MNKETIETAAENYRLETFESKVGLNHANAYVASIKDAFEKGAEWQKQQSANEAVEFFKWVNLNYIEYGFHYEDNIKISSYVHRSDGGVPLRIEKLYELWQKSKQSKK